MAQTISHEAQAPVKTDDSIKAGDAPSKARLATLLESSYEQMEDIQEQLAELSEMINPEPAPLPDSVDPNVLFAKVALSEERDAVEKAAEALGAQVETFQQAVKRMKGRLLHGRNRQAWKVILEKFDAETYHHLDYVQSSITALMAHVSLLSGLVTFAVAEDVSDAMTQEGGNV